MKGENAWSVFCSDVDPANLVKCVTCDSGEHS
jgi:hypothetical protein